jgi:hypothetical protein
VATTAWRRLVGPRVAPADLRARRWRYRAPTLLLFLAAVTLIVTPFVPMWRLRLHAPQYPKGLVVRAHLDHLEGDVHEIDELNHYIGMRPLGDAAPFERAISAYAIVAMSLLVAAAIFVHTRWAAALTLPALAFPAVFLVDLHLWMRAWGRHLDPTAPLSTSIKPFVPPVLGTGKIAQFSTVATPDVGLYASLVASVLIVVGLYYHRRAYKPLVDADAAAPRRPEPAGRAR